MKTTNESILLENMQRAGIIGMPPVDVIRSLNEHNITIYDLDEPLVKVDLESVTPYLPRVYCSILRTAVANALHLDLDVIFADVGPGKCDSALYTADILKDILSIPVKTTCNEDADNFGMPISKCNFPLIEKLKKITQGVKSASLSEKPPSPCEPTAGFWGVPPRDFSILSLFPDTTHVYGWTRCMENKTPANAELEAHYNPDIPTVFFSQSFCAKTSMARWLAKKHHHGLYLDVDVHTTSSAKAKISAFLELSRTTK